MILIGSTAIKHWYPDFNRVPKDLDYAVETKRTNILGTEYLYNPVLVENFQGNILTPELLLTLKASHLCWNINWDKHMYDVQFLLKKGNKIDEGLFWKLYSFWNIYHSKNKRSNLKMSKEEFFNNAINYDFLEHDVTHTFINPVPIYTKVLKDNSEVELDKTKFNLLSFEEKLLFVKEEVMVMAWERYKNLSFKAAYSRMLKKFIISHVPLFALLFTIENYVEILNIKENYFKLIENGINESKQVVG